MARPVRDDRLQGHGLARELEHGVRDLLDRPLVSRADVVRLPLAAVLQDELDGATVVVDVEPLAAVSARGVERELEVVERVRDEERDQLLGELARPVVVRAVRDRHRQPVRLVVGAGGVVGGSLGGVVRRPRPVGRVLGEGVAGVERQVAVDLARRDVVEAGDAVPARRLEQRLRAEHVRAEEAAGVDHGEAVVRLRREVDDDADLLLREQPLHELEVADVSLDEPHVEPVEVAPVAGVREQVERDHVVVRVTFGPVADEVRADEARRPRDEDAPPAHGRRAPRTKSFTA